MRVRQAAKPSERLTRWGLQLPHNTNELYEFIAQNTKGNK